MEYRGEPVAATEGSVVLIPRVGCILCTLCSMQYAGSLGSLAGDDLILYD